MLGKWNWTHRQIGKRRESHAARSEKSPGEWWPTVERHFRCILIIEPTIQVCCRQGWWAVGLAAHLSSHQWIWICIDLNIVLLNMPRVTFTNYTYTVYVVHVLLGQHRREYMEAFVIQLILLTCWGVTLEIFRHLSINNSEGYFDEIIKLIAFLIANTRCVQ